MLRDPALLIWLDAPENTKGHPNENLARELMELFTLGIGHYSEDDVKQAARALTGWRLVGDEVRLIPVAARRGHQDHPRPHRPRSTPTAWRRCSSTIPRRPAGWPGGSATSSSARGRSTNGAIDALAEGLRAHDLDIGWGVATVLRSRLFFDAANLGRRIAEPDRVRRGRGAGPRDVRPGAEHAGAGRLVRRGWARTCSIRPTSAAGPGGRAWITTRSAIGRANFAAALVDGEAVGLGTPFDPIALAARHGQGRNPSFFAQLLLGADGPEVPLDAAGAGPAGPGSTAGLARGAADLTPFLRR